MIVGVDLKIKPALAENGRHSYVNLNGLGFQCLVPTYQFLNQRIRAIDFSQGFDDAGGVDADGA